MQEARRRRCLKGLKVVSFTVRLSEDRYRALQRIKGPRNNSSEIDILIKAQEERLARRAARIPIKPAI